MIHAHLLVALVIPLLFQGLDGTIEDIDLKNNALDEECGISNAIVHKEHNSTEDNVESIKLKDNRDHAHTDKIFGQRNWPWMAIIRNNAKFLCNGMLVRKDYILTTGSCLKGKKPSKIIVDLKGIILKVKDIKIHEGFQEERNKKLSGDIAIVRLAEDAPVEDSNSGLMSICLPRSTLQPYHAQECAVSYLWETDSERDRIEMDTAAVVEDNKKCDKLGTKVEGKSTLLTCVSTKERKKPFEAKKGQVVYFLTCKTSGYWSVFGLSKFYSVDRNNKMKKQYSYYLTLVRYLPWIKKLIYKKKPLSLA